MNAGWFYYSVDVQTPAEQGGDEVQFLLVSLKFDSKSEREYARGVIDIKNEAMAVESAESYRPTKAIINLEAIRNNVKSLKEYVGKKTSVIAVVKADGYGHGEIEVAQTAIEAGAEMVAVATPEEAVRLRKSGNPYRDTCHGTIPRLFCN